MRDHIRLQINHEEYSVRGRDAFLTLSDFLRHRLRLTGTKVVCSEGDCGSCTVLCGEMGASDPVYRPIDSCIRFVFQLDYMHIVTIEGLNKDGQLNAIQQAMVDCHGSQCGFCTPGFVVAMTGLKQHDELLSEEQLRLGLTGNLCRCTGYTPIIQAGLCSSNLRAPRLESENGKRAADQSKQDVEITTDIAGTLHRVYCPVSLAQAIKFLAKHPRAKIVAGATDVGVQVNKGHLDVSEWLDVNRVRELAGIAIAGNRLTAGARVTWTELAEAIQAHLSEFHAMISVFGSPQIRHVGTIGGNIVNASPIADSLPFLFACNAELTIAGRSGERTVDINDFYLGYKAVDLHEGELLTQISFQLPTPNRMLRLYKVSRRRDLDIATFTGAIWVELDGDYISDAGIAYGAVAPVVVRLNRTEEFLRGKPFSMETMTQAGDVAVDEISPISDVRGQAEYRLQLARNVLKKFYYQIEQDELQAT